jgi:hypothetical protein
LTTPDAATARGGRLGAVVFVCAIFLLASAAPASAQWRPIVRSCASFTAVSGCATVANFDGAWDVAVAPGGRHAYATAWDTGAVHIFNRNPTTGALTHVAGANGCLTEALTAGCTQVHGITEADDILITDNGKNVYVTGWNGSIAVFDRNTTTGVLTQKGGTDACINDDGSDACFDGRSVGGVGAVLSRDQKSVYVAGSATLAVFSRNTTTGTLTQLPLGQGCFGSAPATDNCTPTPAAAPGGRQLAISADGKQLYVPSPSNGFLVFNRDPSTGQLGLKPGGQGCFTQAGASGCTPIPPFGYVEAVTLSPDNRFAYVSSDAGIVTFSRAALDGTLTRRSCLNDSGTLGCANANNITSLVYMAVSPDGEDLVAVNTGAPGGLTLFARNTTTGALARRPGPDGCLSADGRGIDNGMLFAGRCRASAAVSTHGHVRFFGNGLIYAGFYDGDRIAVFKRDYYPVCASRAVTVPRNTATSIPLTCSDRNGDAIVRSIAEAPRAGTLGSIDQTAGTVFYNPFNRYSGQDRFTFRATAAGLAGAPASIAITVPKPRKKRKRIRVDVAFSYLAYSDKTVLSKLQVKRVPRGARVRATCRVRGHKCSGKAAKAFLKKRARGKVSLAKRFVGVDLPIGAKITIVVTKRRTVGAVKILTMRPRLAPKVTTRCLRPGAKKPRRRC